MAKVTLQHTVDPLPVAGTEVRWGVAHETLVWELLPLKPKSVANVFPRVWKDGQVQFMLRWAGG